MSELWHSGLVVSLCCLLGGCNQRSAETVHADPTPTAQAQAKEPVAGFSGFSTEEPLPTATLARSSPLEVETGKVFDNPEANQAAADYAQAFGEIKSGTSAPVGDPAANPESVTASLNELGARLDRLNQAKVRIESSLGPGERARWKALRKSIEQPEEP